MSREGLRRRVQGRRASVTGRELGQPEVEHLGVPAFGDEDVGGLDVAVQDAFGVRQLNRVGDLHGQVEHRRQRQRLATDEPIERLTFEVLHRDVPLAFEVADVVTVQMPGWFIDEAAFASRSKRSSAIGSRDSAVGRNFRTSGRPRRVSSAR